MGATSKKRAITAAALIVLTLGLVSACGSPEEPETEKGSERPFFSDPIQLGRATNIFKDYVSETFEGLVDAKAYYYLFAIKPNEILASFSPFEEEIIAPEAGVFFWLDLEPSARFGHATRFVLVADSGTVHEYERRFGPFLSGRARLDDATDREDTTLQIPLPTSDEIEPTSQDRGSSGSSFFSFFPSTVYADGSAFLLKPSGPCRIGRAPRHFAIVIQGDSYRETQTKVDPIIKTARGLN